MPVTDQQAATLRAMLAGQRTAHERLFAQFDRQADSVAYSALLNAAFFEAVDRRFGKDVKAPDIVEFVADVRSRSDHAASAVDPRVAERLIRKVVVGEATDDIDPGSSIKAKLYLVAALVADEDLDDAGLDLFIVKARKLADYLLS